MKKWTREQLDDHRLEIENRIQNLFWTVSGDYKLDVKTDIYDFGRSKYIALYDAIKYGAFARYFDQEQLALYIMKKVYHGAQRVPLMELVQICIDEAVYPKLCPERKGIDEIRQQTFRDYLKDVPPADHLSLFQNVRRVMMMSFLGLSLDASVEAPYLRVLEKIHPLANVSSTDEIIRVIDEIYNTSWDEHFEEEHGSLDRIINTSSDVLLRAASIELTDDDQMNHILQKYLKNLQMDMLRLQIEDHENPVHTKKEAPVKNLHFADATEESEKKVHEYVELSYGRSYLTPAQSRHEDALYCRGVHRGCSLYFTEGILNDPVKKNNQFLYSRMLNQKNRMYYYGNHRIIKRNIENLTETLNKSFAIRYEKECWRDRSGELVPSRLWKLGRTDDDKLFNKSHEHDDQEFVVDLLLDSSGSQMKRAPQIASQGYIIAEALTRAGIPCRATSFLTFWDYTILHRFRDYDDPRDKNPCLFEYQASAGNRDGLAIKAVAGSLLEREEAHRILIILSDGKPSDYGRNSREGAKSLPYVGEEAIRDTALEVRRARAMGIAVLGIFAGDSEDLEAEKKIFGKDFAYIRNIGNFANVVSTFLQKQIEESD